MKTKITFKKSNSDSLIAKYELYRSTSKDGLFAIENKIGEVTDFSSSETVSFIDPSSAYGSEYYYGLMAVTKAGYGIPSAPMYSCRYKNNGGVKPDFLVGNLQAGVVGYNLVEPYGLHAQMDSIWEKAVAEVGIGTGTAKNTNPTPSDYVVTGYYRGMPTHWLMCGFRALTNNNASTQTDHILNSFNPIYNNAKQKTPVILVNGFEYYYETVSIDEWSAVLEGLEIAFSATSLVKKQPLTHSAYSSAYATSRLAILKNQSSTHTVYKQVVADGPLTALAAGATVGSGLTYPGFCAPIALRPVQQ